MKDQSKGASVGEEEEVNGLSPSPYANESDRRGMKVMESN